MDLAFDLEVASACFCIALALVAPFRSRQKASGWLFSAGMLLFGAERILQAISLRTGGVESIAYFQRLALLIGSALPGVWFCFSMSYSRADFRRSFIKRHRQILLGSLVPVALAFAGWSKLVQVLPYSETDPTLWLSFALPGKLLQATFLLGSVLILTNLERTLRSSVGRARWTVKFLLLGLGLIFGARIYSASQILLFSGCQLTLDVIETAALLLGCSLIVMAGLRGAFGEIDVYPSRAVLQTSLTVLMAGAYLLLVGLLAQIVSRLEGARSFQLQTFFLLMGVVVLSILLLSEKVRQVIRMFVTRHFNRPQHDFRTVWTRFTDAMAGAREPVMISTGLVRLLSDTFGVLSVSIWLVDAQNERITLAASTSEAAQAANGLTVEPDNTPLLDERLHPISQPFDLDTAEGESPVTLRKLGRSHFNDGGHRICVPLRAADRWLGFAILADRVGGIPYSGEELDLLECIGGQVGACLLNLRFAEEITAGREFEAFQKISAFFVHDLKNAASTLNLMLTNLPVHFDNPAFRADALRGIESTVKRINRLVTGAGALKDGLRLTPTELDLNALLAHAIEQLNGHAGPKWITSLQPIPSIAADREQLQSVVMNLLLNAADAVGENGLVRVETHHRNGWAEFSVIDNGCGMSTDFVQQSLFRPFRSTKREGLGIGMFQSKVIIEAHRGRILVDSQLGSGTTFRVQLPVKSCPA